MRGAQSQYELTSFKELCKSFAFWLKNTKLTPGGTINPFWQAATITSAPQLSI